MITAATALVTLSVLYFTIRYTVNAFQYEKARKSFNCGVVKRYPHKDPLLGLDLVYAIFANLKKHRFLEYQKELYSAQGCRTFEANFLGTRMIFSSEDENMKAMQTTMWKDFGVQPIRQGNGALKPLGTHGASSTDGELWEYSRNLIKPYFNRAEYSALSRLDGHIDRLIERIPVNGGTVDLQPLFQRWFLDNSTELLFGESLNSQDHPDRFQVAQDMIDIMRGLRIRVQMTKLIFLHRDAAWLAAVNRVRAFMDVHVDKALADLAEEKATGKKAVGKNGLERTDLLYTVTPNAPSDREVFRSQVLNVFFSSNETTSILLSNVFFALARNPDIYAKLREEVLSYGDGEISWQQLRSMAYLRYVVNETHRIYPVSLQTTRVALNDTTLPTGGGPSGKLPIFIRKGDIVNCNRYLMHRDPEYWGADAEEFKPERWATARPYWKFVPFGGGPRICPAHVLVDTECSYMIFKIVRVFKTLEARDERPYTAIMRAGPSSLFGVKVGLVAA